MASDSTTAGGVGDVDPPRWTPAPPGTAVAAVVVVDAQVAVDRSHGRRGDDSLNLPAPVDAMLGLTVGAAATAVRTAAVVGRALAPVARPAVAVVLRPPLIPERFWPATRLAQLAQDGRIARRRGARQLNTWVDAIVPAVLNAVLDRIDLTELVLDRVALLRIVESIDLDAIAAKLDLDAILRRVDVDGIVATVDLDAVIARIDLPDIANQVIDGIDLPQIIRESSGAMASETVIGVRMRSAEADERLNRIADRVLLRRRTPKHHEVPKQ